jgi:hypothetical protein
LLGESPLVCSWEQNEARLDQMLQVFSATLHNLT